MKKKWSFNELNRGAVSTKRHKALGSIVRRKKVSYEEARKIQSRAILKSQEK